MDRSPFVQLTPKGLGTVRRWATALTIGSFLFGFGTGIIPARRCSSATASG